LERLVKAEGGRQKQIHYNPTWNSFKELSRKNCIAKKALVSTPSAR